MASIWIVDDKTAASAFLKLSLMRRRHRVRRGVVIRDAMDAPADMAPDLILINRDFANESGWQVFNQLKQAVPHLPAMVYVLREFTAANAKWIGRVVDAAILEIRNGKRAVKAASVRSGQARNRYLRSGNNDRMVSTSLSVDSDLVRQAWEPAASMAP